MVSGVYQRVGVAVVDLKIDSPHLPLSIQTMDGPVTTEEVDAENNGQRSWSAGPDAHVIQVEDVIVLSHPWCGGARHGQMADENPESEEVFPQLWWNFWQRFGDILPKTWCQNVSGFKSFWFEVTYRNDAHEIGWCLWIERLGCFWGYKHWKGCELTHAVPHTTPILQVLTVMSDGLQRRDVPKAAASPKMLNKTPKTSPGLVLIGGNDGHV